jgi:hypothetical protein
MLPAQRCGLNIVRLHQNLCNSVQDVVGPLRGVLDHGATILVRDQCPYCGSELVS